MPWRKRAQVLGAVAVFVLAVIAELVLIERGWSVPGGVALACTVLFSILALQAYWVRFDLPAPLGAWRATFASSSGTGVQSVLGRRAVALTFDDGPGPDTPAVLDALDRVNVHATFFLLGAAVRARPDLAREIARRGHVIGIHGDTHRKLHLALPGTIAHQIDAAIEALRVAGIDPVPLFRAPHGFKGPLLASALRRRGLRLVGWTRGVWDSDAPPTEVIVKRATRDMKGGEILLLHDGAAGSDRAGGAASRAPTAAAIPDIVTSWQRAGFEFVTLEALSEPVERDGSGSHDTSMAEQRGADEEANFGPTLQAEPAAGSRRTRRASTIVRAILVAALAILVARALRHFDLAELGRALGRAELPLLVVAAAANVLALAMQAGRWYAVVHPVDRRARARDAFFALVAGYAVGLVVPARASDLARAHLMSRRTGVSTITLTTTAVVDHLLGSIALLGAIAGAAAVWPVPDWLRRAGALAAAVAFGVLVTLWFIRPRRGSPPVPGKLAYSATTGAAANPDPAGPRRLGAAGRFIARLRVGLVAVGSPRALGMAGMFAMAGWMAEGLIAHLALRAFGLPSGVAPSMMAVLATTLSAAASVSPGNAGAFELACVAALAGFGVPQEAALAFAIGYHCVHLLPTAVIGGGWLIVSGFRPAALRGLT